jgi:sulfate/thiosulfate transport system permease protein
VATFLSVIVLLPIAALTWASRAHGLDSFWTTVSSAEAVSSLKLSLWLAAAAALTNAVFGTITAWELVRDSFPGKSLINSIIDLPFALPTIVVGLVLLALYGIKTPLKLDVGGVHLTANISFTRWAIYFALVFVTLPFVIRTVQPVLIELDHEMEEAAAVLGASPTVSFRRIVLPNILPGILSGLTMAFARAVGEVGSVVLISGNLPFKTEVASVFVLQRAQSDPTGGAAVSVVLLAISFSILLVIGGLRRFATRYEHG